MLFADHNRESRPLDVLVEEADQALLLFHHLYESAKRVERETLPNRARKQQGRAFDVECMMLRQLFQRRAGQPERAREQLVVERALLFEAFEYRFADLEE